MSISLTIVPLPLSSTTPNPFLISGDILPIALKSPNNATNSFTSLNNLSSITFLPSIALNASANDAPSFINCSSVLAGVESISRISIVS